MRYWMLPIASGVLTLLLVAVLPSPPPTTSSTPTQRQQASAQNESRQSEQGYPRHRIAVDQNQRSARPDKQNKREKHFQTRYLATQIILAVGTVLLVFVGAAVGFWQVRLMRGSLKATTDAANAAKESAEHVRRTERAWVLGHSNGPLKGWIAPNENLDAPFEGRIIQVDWGLSNHGNTPAWITKADVRFEVHDWPLPDEPFVVGLAVWNNFPVTKTKAHGGTKWLIVRDEKEWLALLQSYKCFVLYGMIVYRDAFGHLHWGRFCETWRSPQELLSRLAGTLDFRPIGPTPAWTDQDWG